MGVLNKPLSIAHSLVMPACCICTGLSGAHTTQQKRTNKPTSACGTGPQNDFEKISPSTKPTEVPFFSFQSTRARERAASRDIFKRMRVCGTYPCPCTRNQTQFGGLYPPSSGLPRNNIYHALHLPLPRDRAKKQRLVYFHQLFRKTPAIVTEKQDQDTHARANIHTLSHENESETYARNLCGARGG